MLFAILVLIDIVLLFVTVKNSLFKNLRFVFSLGVCAWGIKRLFSYYDFASYNWLKYFDRFEMDIPFQSEIHFRGLETITMLFKDAGAVAVCLTVALIILTLVLRRFDGNIDRAVFLITLFVLIGIFVAALLLGIVTVFKIPYFAYILFIQALNVTAVSIPALMLFNNVCRGKVPTED